MIPKIIHYCWFGNKPIPTKEQKCMKTWQNILPEYKIIRWDENSFDINSNPFTKEAYRLKKYAFVADYVRLYALTTFGGIYLDTDIEIIRSLDDLLAKHKSFGGFETPNMLQTGVLACEKGNTIFEEFFKGKTVEEIKEFFATSCSDLNGRPLINPSKDEDVEKRSKLTDEQKAELDSISGATMSLNDAHGDLISSIEKAAELAK